MQFKGKSDEVRSSFVDSILKDVLYYFTSVDF